MNKKPVRNLFFLFAITCLALLVWKKQRTPATPVTSPPPHAEITDPAPEKAIREATPVKSRRTAPENLLRTSHGEEFRVSFREAMLLEADGTQKPVALRPPATPATLRERLAELNAAPIAYPVNAEPTRSSQRVITPDLSVKIEEARLSSLLENHALTLKQRPDYAPGWVILSAADPLAALAVIDAVRETNGVSEADVIVGRFQTKRSLPNDPLIAEQWHLANNNSIRTHANVEPIWNYPNATGVRGSGVRIGIIDDGIDLTHPDFTGNLDTTNDRDFIGNDDNPSANASFDDFHGTACAGVAGARGNNNLGVSGVAPLSTLVGLRLITDQSTATDAQEAAAMGWKNDIIQVKSNSWGPSDNGRTLVSERPGNLTLAALANATETGRNGKGTIFVWAGGNGGDSTDRDHSNYDGYANSIHTIAVAASNSDGRRSVYSEQGANLIVCAPSDGNTSQLAITTTDLVGNKGYNTKTGSAGNYADDFGGTSSATPVVAGVVALMLEKNPNLGWRDVQEILIRSAFKISPADAAWADNSASFHFHPSFGAGLVDATAAVNLADGWQNLAPQTSVTSTQSALSVAIPDNNATGITRTFPISETVRVEHVTLRLNTTHGNHRNLAITLTSPSGMVSELGVPASGKTGEALTKWTFSSVRHWGENSAGTWTLNIADRVSGSIGSLTAAELVIFGSSTAPMNQPPQITAATLSQTGIGFSDLPLGINISANDPENDPISYSYQWQSSVDAIAFSDEPETSATLTANTSRAGKLWRCVITASDGNSDGPPFTTATVNLLTRPPASVVRGTPFSYTSGLVLAANASTISRDAIINEFSQGPGGGTSEWVEILTLRTTSLRFHDLQSVGRILVFRDSPVWDNIPAGTLIVVYNGLAAKDPRLPANGISPADGLMVLSSANTTYFDPDPNYDTWIALGNSGDYLLLSDQDGNEIHGLSYGSNSEVSPYIGSVGSATSAFFSGDQEAAASRAASWSAISQASSTPGAGNNSPNSAFVTNLRNGTGNSPALFRLGSGVTLPDGLSLNATTGTLAGTVSPTAAPGPYAIIIERFNSTPAVVSQSFTLNVTTPTFANWISSFAPLADLTAQGDPDADTIPNLFEYALNLNPGISETSPAILFHSDGSSLHLTYRVHKAHSDVAIFPEWAATLAPGATWSGTGITTILLENNLENQLRRASLPISAQDPQRFLHLRAIQTTPPAP